MRPHFALVILALAGSVLMLCPDVASAQSFGKSEWRPICPPYCEPCFGFYPTRWRPWPDACRVPTVGLVEGLAAPSPALEKMPKEEPAKGKNGPKEPEKAPAPKSSSVRIPMPSSPYAPFLPPDRM